MSTRVQGHCLTFVQCHSFLYFQTDSKASKAMWPISAKFHMDPLRIGETKCYPGHVTKMAATLIHGPEIYKNHLPRTLRVDDFKLGILHRHLEPYNIYTNGDPGLTLPFLWSRSNVFPNAFVLKNATAVDFTEIIEVYESLVQIIY